jgi:hypothetical protein
MKERWTEVSSDARDKQEQHFIIWLSGEGIPFEGSEAERAYRSRITLLKDAIQLTKPPQRVPVCPSPGSFPVGYAGLTPYESMYDEATLRRAWEKYYNDFAPDVYNAPTTAVVSGRVLDLLDFNLYKWPGHGLSREQPFQFVEREYMKADEYPDLIDDPSGYFLRVYFTRIFGALKPFEKMPIFPLIHEMPLVPPGIAPFGASEFQKALHDLMTAASEAAGWLGRMRALNESIIKKGYPAFLGGFSKAPFDVVGDSLRGTAGVMMDMYRRPDELLEACTRLTPFMIKAGVAAGKASRHPLIFMPLHKGADGFMSDKQFRMFYWPTLKKVIVGLVNEGMVPVLFAEGGYNSRLEAISELPKGATVWWFDLTDMVRAKETVGKVACIAGNVPLPLLCAGTENEVKEYCRTLIDTVGRDGGFILSTGAGMDGAKPENVKAMIDFSKHYGVCS